jgi:hypothetical protein
MNSLRQGRISTEHPRSEGKVRGKSANKPMSATKAKGMGKVETIRTDRCGLCFAVRKEHLVAIKREEAIRTIFWLKPDDDGFGTNPQDGYRCFLVSRP